jgi:hypothetical protein
MTVLSAYPLPEARIIRFEHKRADTIRGGPPYQRTLARRAKLGAQTWYFSDTRLEGVIWEYQKQLFDIEV